MHNILTSLWGNIFRMRKRPDFAHHLFTPANLPDTNAHSLRQVAMTLPGLATFVAEIMAMAAGEVCLVGWQIEFANAAVALGTGEPVAGSAEKRNR